MMMMMMTTPIDLPIEKRCEARGGVMNITNPFALREAIALLPAEDRD
jgi:hypothetical protein